MLTAKKIYEEFNNPSLYYKSLHLLQTARSFQIMPIELTSSTYHKFYIQDEDYHFHSGGITLQNKDREVLDHVCDCATYRNTGFCEHCGATLLKTFEEEYGITEEEYAAVSDKASALLTSKGVRNLLHEVDNVLPTLASDRSHSVHLYPNVSLYRDRIEDHNFVRAEFRIGRTNGRTYVLKDISTLVTSAIDHRSVRYGKELEFVPCLDSFDEASVDLFQYLIKRHEEYNRRKDYYYNAFTSRIGRTIDISDDSLDAFMSALQKTEFLCSDEEAVIVENAKTKKFFVEKYENGFKLTLPEAHHICTSNYAYIFSFDDTVAVINKIKKTSPVLEKVLEYLEKINYSEQFITNEDMHAFTKNISSSLFEFAELHSEDYNPEDYLPQKPHVDFYLDLEKKKGLTCKPKLTYDSKEYKLFEKKDLDTRNLEYEQYLTGKLNSLFAHLDKDKNTYYIQDEEEIINFTNNSIPQLEELGTLFGTSALKKLKIHDIKKVNVGVSLRTGLLDITLDMDETEKKHLIEILDTYQPNKRYYRLKNGDFVKVENEQIDTLHNLTNDLDIKGYTFNRKHIKIAPYNALHLAKYESTDSLVFNKDKAFQKVMDTLENFNATTIEVPSTINATLRDYQVEGFKWLYTLKELNFGALLADEMGLGKTLQVITLLASCDPTSNHLIVTPASLVYNWKNEIDRFAPQLNAVMLVGTKKERQQLLENANGCVLITSYDTLKRDIELYDYIGFDVQVIDEAQYIKNPTTQASECVKDIQANFKIALTGTPIENRLSELWSIFDYLMPNFLYSQARFRRDFETPIVIHEEKEPQTKLHNMIAPFVLRRLKKDVLKDLPDKIEEVYYAKLSSKQEDLYNATVARLKEFLASQSEEDFNNQKLYVLKELTHLRQILCSPSLVFSNYRGNSAKEDLAIELITNAIEEGHKILFFSQFTSMLDRISKELNKRKIKHYTITGKTSKENRAKQVEQFNNDDTPIFLISLKAGGTGLNLTAADIVIHYDPWWNTAVQNQATDRAHRIGQTNIVNVYSLIMKDSIEEKILQLQQMKKELADEILSGEEIASTILTKEQLFSILE